MRSLVTILLIICLLIAFLPGASADTPPILLWPSEELIDRANTSNLTVWFANKLRVTVDESRPGGWHTVDEPNRPDFLRVDEVYVLPLIDGEVEAIYIEGGVLRSIYLNANTSYMAKSDEETSMRAIIGEIASDLGLDVSGSKLNIEMAILWPGTSNETCEWGVHLVRDPEVGTAIFFNGLSITIRELDLRVISVAAQVWYEIPGNLSTIASEAILAAETYARSGHEAVDPDGTVIEVAVQNRTGFAFHIYTSWYADPESQWNLEIWVDGSTYEILFEDGPYLTTYDSVPPTGRLPWIPVILIVALVVLVSLSIFYRLTAEHALDHFTRGRILGYVQANPGSINKNVREALGLTIGTFSYHLWVLERLGFVRSVRQGRVRLLYPMGRPITQSSLVLSELQYALLDILKAKGDSSQTDISQVLKISRQRVHYNVKKLRILNLIEMGSDGKIRLSREGMEFVEKEKNAHGNKPDSRIPSKALSE